VVGRGNKERKEQRERRRNGERKGGKEEVRK
jgi:hypothetical protein